MRTATANGNLSGSGRERRPEVIQKLGVEYWVNLPLEIVEQRIGGRDPKWRVYYTMIRCSYCLPAQNIFAIRPRLRNGGFSGWEARLKKRISEHRPIRRGELQEETVDTDHAGEIIPLSRADVCQIATISRSHLSETLAELITEGLLAPGEVFYPLAVPTAPSYSVLSDSDVPCTGNILARKLSNQLGIKIACTGNTPEAVQALNEAYTALNEGRKALRTDIINMLKSAGTGSGILIEEERRLKREKHTHSFSAPPQDLPTPVQPEDSVRKPSADPFEAADSKSLRWIRFLEAARNVGRLPATGQIDFLQRTFLALPIEEQLAAVAGIDVRLANGEYANPQYVPEMRRYLEEKLWTADLRPRNGTPKRANTVDWSAVIDEDEDA